MCCFLYHTYVYKGLSVYVQLSKYHYETTTDISYKTSWAQAGTNSEKNYEIIKTYFTETIFREKEHIHSFNQHA